MSTEAVRSLLIFAGVTLNIGAMVLNSRDRDRRERATRERPQPIRYTRGAVILTALSFAALIAAVLLFFI